MKRRSLVVVLVLIALPAVWALADFIAFQVRNRNNGSIVSSGLEWQYILHVPRSYDRSRPTPLVISLHGGACWPAQQRDASRWNDLAEKEGFLVVYPGGLKTHVPRFWRLNKPRDVRFISDLIDELERSYNIDRRRIYANGLSNGGAMSFVLSCTMSDRIAAVGTVGAAHTLPWSWCTDRRPVPVINFHGTADTFAPYEGGSSWVAPRPFPNVPNWTATWARRNRCAAEPTEVRVAADVTRRTYTNCARGADVVLYTIHDGGHVWPGGGEMPEWFVGRDSRTLDATAEMWAFFRKHRLDP